MEKLYYIAEYLVMIFNGIFVGYFIFKIFPSKTKHIWHHYTVFVALSFFLSLLLENSYWWQIILLEIFGFTYMLIFYQGDFGKKVIVILSYDVAISLKNVFLINCISIISDGVRNAVSSPDNNIRFIYQIISSIFGFCVIAVLTKFFKDKKYNKESAMLTVIMLVLTILACDLMTRFSGVHGYDRLEKIKFVFITIAMVAINIIMSKALENMSKVNDRKREMAKLDFRIEEERNLLSKIDENYKKIQGMRNNARYYYTIIMSLMEKNDYERVENILNNVLGKEFEENGMVYLSSKVINSVLNDKIELCKKNNILFKIVGNGRICERKEIDVAIILSNLLDNAIEAEKKVKNPVIHLNMHEFKGMFYISVGNRIEASIIKENPHLETTKENKDAHGIGIKSVKHILEKIDGILDINERGNAIYFEVEFANE